MEFPHLNTNGTSRDELASQYAGAIAALNIAIEMMCLAYPHGRDYPSPPCDLGTAMHEHAKRGMALCSVRDDLQLIAAHIAGQTGGR